MKKIKLLKYFAFLALLTQISQNSYAQCGILQDYEINPSNEDSHPKLYVRVNMHFPDKVSGGNNFTYDGDGAGGTNFTGVDMAELLIKKFNHQLANLQPEAAYIINNEIPAVNPKIEFVLTGVYFDQIADNDDILFYSNQAGDYADQFAINDTKVMNIYLVQNDSISGGNSNGTPNNVIHKGFRDDYLVIIGDNGDPFTGNYSGTNNVMHEIFHEIGLVDHIYYGSWLGRTDAVCNANLEFDDGIYDTPTQKQVIDSRLAAGWPNDSCVNPCYWENNQACGTNNIMHSNAQENALTPGQAAALRHSLLGTDVGLLDDGTIPVIFHTNPELDALNASNPSPLFSENTSLCGHSENVQTIQSGQIVTWEDTRIMIGDLVIESGAELTIKCDILFSKRNKITVKKGAKLTVDGGTIKPACNYWDSPWSGIEIFGDENLPQLPNSNQGMVILKNGARIEYAANGVSVIGHDQDGEISWGTAGGILKIDGATFFNCRRAGEFMEYQNMTAPYKNMSYIKNCDVLINDDLGQHFSSIVAPRGFTFWGVDKINITNCTFINDIIANSDFGPDLYNGIGILTYDASLNIKTTYNGPSFTDNSKPEQYWSRNNFTGWEYGIRAANWSELERVSIKRSDFLNNSIGADFSNIKPIQFVRNHVDVPDHIYDRDSTNLLSPEGVRITADAYDMELEENNFQGAINTFPDTNVQTNKGVVIVNTGKYDNEIYRNNFNYLVYPFHSSKNNQGETSGINQGFELHCNDFGQITDNYRDVSITHHQDTINLNGAHPGIDQFQGVHAIDNDDIHSQSGNRYSTNPTKASNGHMSGSVSPVTPGNFNGDPYHIHQFFDPDLTFGYSPYKSLPGNVERIESGPNDADPVDREQACPEDISTGILEGPLPAGGIVTYLSNLKTNIDVLRSDLQFLLNNYQAVLNGGIREDIMNALLDPNEASQDIRTLLIQGSPYLEDDILIECINRAPALDQWHLTEILVWNAPLSGNVMNVLDAQMPLSAYLYSLVTAPSGDSQKTLYQLDVKSIREALALAETEYLQVALEDENLGNPHQTILSFFTGVNSIRAQKYSIAANLKLSKTRDAETILTNYLGDSNTDHYVDFKTIEIALKDNYKNWFQMDATQLSSIQAMAVDKTKKGWEMSQSVLDLINDTYSAPEEITIDENPPARMASQEIEGPDFTKAPKLMEAYPQPANKELYITFEVPDNMLDGIIHISNVLGQSIDNITIGNLPLKRLDVSSYNNGIYFMSLLVDGKKVESIQFTVIH